MWQSLRVPIFWSGVDMSMLCLMAMTWAAILRDLSLCLQRRSPLMMESQPIRPTHSGKDKTAWITVYCLEQSPQRFNPSCPLRRKFGKLLQWPTQNQAGPMSSRFVNKSRTGRMETSQSTIISKDLPLVSTHDQLADGLTKPLQIAPFQSSRSKIGVTTAPPSWEGMLSK